MVLCHGGGDGPQLRGTTAVFSPPPGIFLSERSGVLFQAVRDETLIWIKRRLQLQALKGLSHVISRAGFML